MRFSDGAKRTRGRSQFLFAACLIFFAGACSSPTSETESAVSSTSTSTSQPASQAPREFEGKSASVADCEYGGLIRSIEALNKDSVRFSLCRPDVLFLSKVAHPGLGILPSDYLESSAGGLALVETPIGTGPFFLERWDDGTQIVLGSNSTYWAGAPPTDHVVVRWNADPGERLAELRSGAVDAIDGLAADDFERIASDAELQLIQHLSFNTMYLGMNQDRAPLNDLRVRQAIAHALDRDRLVDSFYPLGSVAAEQFLPRTVYGYAPQVSNYEFDVEQSVQKLVDAGYEEGFEIVLSYSSSPTSYLPDPTSVAERIKFQLVAVGVVVTLEVLELEVLEQRAASGELDLFLSGIEPDLPGAIGFLDSSFGSEAPLRFGAAIPELQNLLGEAEMASDLAVRRELYRDAATLIKQELPVLPIAHGATAAAWEVSASGANTSPMNVENFSDVLIEGREAFIWMQSTEPDGLYCGDETRADSIRICSQIVESLLSYQVGGIGVRPGLAVRWQSNPTFTEWTFDLRPDVEFHDGSAFDANDVVLSYLVQWDKSHPLHSGRTGQFANFAELFGALAELTS